MSTKTRSNRSLFLFISMVMVLSLVLAACGGGDDDDTGDEAPVATATEATETEATTPPEAEETADDAAAGEALWEAQCMSCHTIDGSEGLGPTWQGLWMADVPLDDGSVVTGDEAYITESIMEPNAKIHEGFQGVMPEFDLDDDEIANVIAFIQTLE